MDPTALVHEDKHPVPCCTTHCNARRTRTLWIQRSSESVARELPFGLSTVRTSKPSTPERRLKTSVFQSLRRYHLAAFHSKTFQSTCVASRCVAMLYIILLFQTRSCTFSQLKPNSQRLFLKTSTCLSISSCL